MIFGIPKTKFYIWAIVAAISAGYVIYNEITRKSAREIELEMLESEKELKDEQKQELRRVRDSAKTVRDTLLVELNDTVDYFYNQSKQIKYVPYTKYEYVDRTVDDAIDILNSTKYEQ